MPQKVRTFPSRRLVLCILLVSVLFPCFGQTQAAAPSMDRGHLLSIDGLLAVYEDPDSTLSPAKVLDLYSRGAMTALGDRAFDKGYTRSSFWLAFRMPYHLLGKKLTLFTISEGLYNLSLYLPKTDGSFEEIRGSYKIPFSQRATPLPNPSVTFELTDWAAAADGGILLFRISSDSSINTSFALSDDIGAYRAVQDPSVFLAAIFAILLVMLVYNLVVAVFSRETSYLSYVIYLAFYILYLADLRLLEFRVFLPDLSPQLVTLISPILGSLTLVSSVIFTKVFLEIGKKQKVLSILCYVLMGLGASLGIVAVSGIPFTYISRYGNGITPIIVLAQLGIIIARVAQGYRPAVFYLLANMGAILGVLIFDLSAYGIARDNVFLANANLLGQTLQIVLFALSLAFKLNLERRARLEAQERLARQEDAARRFVPIEFLQFLGGAEISDVALGQMTQERMTVMFSDIRSFTTLSETMSPRQTFDFVNSLLSRIVPTIKDYNGFIDKFIGDATMALFPDDTDAALGAALEMQAAVEDLNQERVAEGLPVIRMGIGMHTGDLMLGVIGDRERMESTVLSDAVNLASRVEKLNKFFGTSILATEETFKNLHDPLSFSYRFLGMVKVKGKKLPASIFEILGAGEERNNALKMKTQRDFEQALIAYLMRDFKTARIKFAAVLRLDPSDKAAIRYYQLSTRALENPPPPEWEGALNVADA